jgi:large subunit ribosomal protein L21
MMFAVIKASGYQYLVSAGETITVPAHIGTVNETVEFDKVLMLKDDSTVKVGKPYLEGAKVKGIIKEHGKMPKIMVFKFRRREKYRRKRGHRQNFSLVEITDIIKGG